MHLHTYQYKHTYTETHNARTHTYMSTQAQNAHTYTLKESPFAHWEDQYLETHLPGHIPLRITMACLSDFLADRRVLW